MGVELLEIGVEMKRILMFSIKRCYVTVLNHPFLVSMLCFIAFLYRSFPFLFSLLLAVSPVLVCTAVLLGTLLSFGQPNIPEIEREEKTSSHEIVPLRTGVLYDTTHIESAEDSYYVERYTERGLVDQSIDKISDLSPLLEERFQDFQFGNGGFEEGGREFNEKKYEEKHGDSDGELVKSPYSSIPMVEEGEEEMRELYEQNNEKNEEKHDKGELLESQYSPIPTVDEDFEEAAREFYEQNSEKSEEKHDDGELMESQYSPIPTVDNESVEFDFDRSDSFDSKRVNLHSLPGSPWKKEREEEEEQEEEEEDDESFDSESDRAESSSPDASMADIIPMLHELHPLLDEDTPQHVSLLHDGSDAASDSSGKTTESDNESDDGDENQEELEVADEENEDEEGKRDEEDKSKSAITWTEEDQKNLIDLGSSEVERNQRLENLMARRRALKKMRVMMTEKNLIDLESADLPFNIPSISTARNNPFDAQNDNYDLGLPPIPGSAPSVLVPRRNPFDLPYDSSEEKPDLMEDEQEFITFQAKDPLFRRHESFIVRPSVFGPKQDMHLRPYFVPERMASEGTSYSPFQRQSSELSDSKVSSVPETESLSSVEDLEDSNLIEGQLRLKNLDQEELKCKNLMDEHISEEPEHTTEHVRHGSQSSEEVEFLVQLGNVENHDEAEETLLQEGRETNVLELNPTEIQSKSETSYQRYSSQSSSSSLAEVSERVFVDKEGEMRSSFEEIMGHVEQNEISRQASFDGPDFRITSTSVDHTSREQPIYDSSPVGIRENTFSASFSSDQHVESETGFPPTLVERTISSVERESEENSQDIEKSLPTNEENLAPADDPEFLSMEVVCQDELDVAKVEISQDDEVFGGANVLLVHELVVGQASIDSKSSADEDILYKEGTIEHAQQQVSSSRYDADTHIVSQLAVDHTVESLSTSSDNQNIHQMGDEERSLVADVPLDQPVMPDLERQSVEDVTEKEETIVSEHSVTDALSEVGETQISVGYQYASTERSISQCEEELAYSDKSIDEQPSEDQEVKEPPTILVEPVEEASTTETLNASENHDFDAGIPIISSPSTPNSIVEAPRDAGLSGLQNMILEENDNQIKVLENYVLPPEAADFHHDEQYIVEETDGIEDIDEAFLYELDTVGDFSFNELGSSLNEFDRQINSTGQGLSAFHTVDSGTTGVTEEVCVEVHERKFLLHSEILKASTSEEIDKHEEKECASEIQTSGMSTIDHIHASHTEFAEGKVQNAVDARSIEGGLPEDSDIGPSDPTANLNLDAQEIVPEMPITEAHNSVFEESNAKSTQTEVTEVPQEQTDSDMPVLEAQTIQDIESAFWTVYEKEMEKSNVFELYNAEDSGMPVLEAQTVEDIELAFRVNSEKEIENSNVYKLPNAKLVTEESGSSNNAVVFEVPSSVQSNSGKPEVEAHTIEDIESAFGINSEIEEVQSNVLELPNAKLVTEESGDSDDAAVFEVSSSVHEDSDMPVVEAQTIEDIESAFRVHSNVLELPNAKLVTEESGDSDGAALFDVSSSVQEDSEMPVVEAQTIEDIDSAFRISSEKEIVHSNVLELPNAKLVTEESGDSDGAALFDVSSSVQEDSEMPVVEAQTIEDIDSAFRISSDKEIVHSNVLELPNAKLVTEESGDSDGAALFGVSSSVQEDSEMPVVEAQTIEDIDSAFRISSEKEIVHSNVLELPNAKLVTEESGDFDDETVFDVSSSLQKDFRMQVPEAQTVDDINLAFSQISEQEIAEKSNVHEQPDAELATEESGDSDNEVVFDVSSSVQKDSGMLVLEAQTVEDINLVFRQISEQEIAEKSYVLEQPDAELATEVSSDSDDAAVFDVSSSVQKDSGMPVLEARTAEDISLAFRQISEQEIEKSDVFEKPNAELETENSGDSDDAAVFEVSRSMQEDSGMPVLEAQTAEDMNLKFREIAEKLNVLEQSNAELATDESRNIAATAEVSSSLLEDSGMQVPETQTVEDIDMVFRRISEKEKEKSNVVEQPNAELATEVSGSADNTAVLEVSSMTRNMQLPILETRPTEYFDMEHEKLSESDDETLIRHDSVGDDERIGESKDIGASSDSQNIETDLALKQVLEGNLEKPLNSTSEGESAEAKPSEAGLSNDMESSVRGSDVPDFGEGETGKDDQEVLVKEAKILTAEKTDHAVDMPAASDVKGKKDKSHKMGSSSSSSSSSV